ncbi:hypothetical protein JOD54_001395 [Actinokineospora baliensis]|uniref:hypothetical protein n=1 Tax=Actinokineospora baliensis TaxID=547056 RepID=UPI00195CF6D2|nr:hypothetical protein [Actinokineospora baliensis]MBM7771191.1 hypothetical protein [Actinokineospora baliensis]
MTLITAELAGPLIHAQNLLAGTGESPLWAAFAEHYSWDSRGFDSARTPRVDVGAIPGKVLTTIVNATDDGPDMDPPKYDPDVVIVSKHKEMAAVLFGMQFGRTLWVLTPRGLRMGLVLMKPEPEPAPEPEPKPKRGLIGGLVNAAKVVTDEVADMWAKQTEWPQMPTYPVEPKFEIPRRDIAGFTVAARGLLRSKVHCLRMELVDGSGFDLIFGAGKDRAQFERLHALTLGAPE